MLSALCIALGSVPMLAVFDIGLARRADIQGPAWLGLATSGVFVVAGLWIAVGRRFAALRDVLVLVLLAGLAAIGNWIAFGAGPRVCTGGLSLAGIGLDGNLSDLGCRVPFGVGALAVNGLIVHATVVLLQKRAGGPPALARTRAASEVALLVALSPVLLVALLLAVVPAAFGVLRARLRTGTWPRNESFIRRQRERLLRARTRREGDP